MHALDYSITKLWLNTRAANKWRAANNTI